MPLTQYVPCNGINAANLLHCPTSKTYDDLAKAKRAAKRLKLSHVADVVDGFVQHLRAVT